MSQAAMLVTRVLATALGAALVVIGLVLLALPGPGLLVVALGLAVLSWQYPALRRWAQPVKARAVSSAERAAADPVHFGGMLVFGAGMIAIGVVWASWRTLPFSSAWSGGGVAVSCAILLATAVWARRSAPRGPTTPGPA